MAQSLRSSYTACSQQRTPTAQMMISLRGTHKVVSLEEEKERSRKSIKGEIPGKAERGSFYSTLEAISESL